MPVSANAVTLGQYALMSNDPLVQKIAMSLLENGSFLADCPLIPYKSLKASLVNWTGNLPTVNWGKINIDPVVTSGTPTPHEEQVYLIRNAIDVDKKLVEDVNQIVDPRGGQLSAYLKSVAYDMNDKVINNDPITGNPDAPVGFRYRVDNPSTYRLHTDMKVNFGGVDMTPGGMTATTANAFIEAVAEMLDYMSAPEGDGVVLYMNDTMKRRFDTAIRKLGAGAGFTTTTDSFGRRVSSFRNAIVRDIGRKADQTTRIILNTETNTGAAGASDYTSIYAAKYGEEALQGWNFDSLEDSVNDVGLVGNGGTIYRTVIDYAVGILPNSNRCICRGYGIKVK